ncbi:hypothetical protein DET49_10679 [Salegentibacter sp. 24]|uniref:hypothetical protein n=1 Tax=Salegentibacter sp. 24 TaxID=2183986 RepID=UPI00105CC319|nr:hypothetical protein [Salegentibacter sp. 24]TDN89334.1 hypothetical protein DET49_10679 [Salegentibacter sp. 24]
MKKLILSLLCIAISGVAYSQGIIKLDEMMVNPPNLEIDEATNAITLNVNEDYKGQFHSNPLKYAKDNFNLMELIQANKGKDFDTYEVTFKTNKGNLKVNYNDKGEIISSYQMFKDVRLPYNAMISILKANKGYTLTGTKHLAYSGSGEEIEKEFYKAKLENGNKSKIVKLNISKDASGMAVATIE